MEKFVCQIGAWKALPDISSSTQIFAVGDVHGQAQALAATLDAIGEVPRCASHRCLIFLGDLIDRGPDSLAVIDLVETAKARSCVDDVIILPGNHELMLLDALDDPMMFMGDWLDNGGDAVIQEALPNSNVIKLAAFAEIALSAIPPWFLDRMRSGPTWHQEGSLLFVHAGLNPHTETMKFLTQERTGVYGTDHWAWIREPFLDWTGGWGPERRWRVVHGHTPAIQVLTNQDLFAQKADQLLTHGRLCLDAGAALDIPQIAWAEFHEKNYRLNLIRTQL
jgi:serine/threonine protein phosphatase 1